MGVAGLATLYAAFTAICIPGPRLVSYLDPKWAMVIGGSTYVLMIIANIPILLLSGHEGAQYAITIPFYFLVGVGAPLLWTGQALYLSRCAELHVRDCGGDESDLKATLSEFNATFFAMFQVLIPPSVHPLHHHHHQLHTPYLARSLITLLPAPPLPLCRPTVLSVSSLCRY